jgi:hypothetical protein
MTLATFDPARDALMADIGRVVVRGAELEDFMHTVVAWLASNSENLEPAYTLTVGFEVTPLTDKLRQLARARGAEGSVLEDVDRAAALVRTAWDQRNHVVHPMVFPTHESGAEGLFILARMRRGGPTGFRHERVAFSAEVLVAAQDLLVQALTALAQLLSRLEDEDLLFPGDEGHDRRT